MNAKDRLMTGLRALLNPEKVDEYTRAKIIEFVNYSLTEIDAEYCNKLEALLARKKGN